ncbi:MAG TPA: SDR family NAD(P)-dependent oxidoreductase [Gemmatimonadota bacterium]|nr:SDR family NAD(P)-dependent oxidoreductase [Gemmatimonadota bacterium]
MWRTPLHPAILGITPFHRPDPRLAMALCRAGARGALDLGRDPTAGREALSRVAGANLRGLGVRVHSGFEPSPEELPDAIEFVIVEAGADVARWSPRPVLARAVSLAEARAAVAAGAQEILAAGAECGGRVGEESTFVLLQKFVANLDVPVWAMGGIGLHTAAACAAGGAAGIVLDSQLALVRESTLPADVARAIRTMDGSETVVLAGQRVFSRPDLPLPEELRAASAEEVAARLGGDDLRGRLVPAGQDAAFARPLAERFVTAGGVVQGIARAIDAHLESARDHRPLAPGSPLAVDHGTHLPVLQGPMTRVSDRAEFASAVAEAGGLPFLALSLLRGDTLRGLLDETAVRLGDRPWGVGILGFVPPELRAEQLDAIASSRPPFALIAGGRPSQARGLEERGIPTYLHVPSRGLLDLFLKEGARRFVFEGRECGGHVGPLSSFVLWQSQVDRLLEFDRPAELSVVFAGGIQDARSAAMVAALAAPLAARGARVGILMGTAYLFTREAVETGAIVPAYQRAALECGETVLLETGPGHATRCADSPYARGFRVERERLERVGADPKELWARLEHLNLGRLRMASKGLRRLGDHLVEIGEEEQRAEGMYMIGQAAALRAATCSMAELHREVTEGATDLIEAVAASREDSGALEPRASDVAIVGMACVFPGASDLDAYWSNIVRGVNSIREVPHERWDPEVYYDPDGVAGQTTPSKWGGFLDPVAFEPTRYGIPPRSLSSIDPAQLLSLEVARRALEDAGYGRREFDRERAAVVFGTEGGSDLSHAYGFRALYPRYAGALPQELDAVLPVPTEDSFPGVLANVISGRIANRLDLGGENYTVNAACASSLASVSVGMHWLESGACDMVLAGGADLHCSIGDFLMFSSVHALSPSGQCRTFDQSADGIAIGEGVGVVVLKRLADAERDGDRIYAVIKGIAGSSDGRSLGLTAPRLEGQIRALERAWDRAGLPPESVGLMEAHGTGTVVGDRTELQSMERVFGDRGIEPGACVLGSIKSSIGHSKAAAGVASLIKVALCLHHRVLPPTLNLQRPNPYWSSDTSPFSFRDRSHPWIGEPRVGAISAFGFGGTNYHAVLASHDGDERPVASLPAWPEELFLVRGADAGAARARAERLLARAEDERPRELRELARATSCGGEGPVHWAIVARSHEDLAAKLKRALAGEVEGEEVLAADAEAGDPGRVAFLFAGQGSQHVDMLADLFVAFPDLRDLLEENPEIAARMFPPRAFSPRERAVQEAALTRTDVAQVALGLADCAMARVLERVGIVPDMLAGHSYGELVALGRAGAWEERDVARLSRARGRAILDAAGDDPGAMAAVNATVEEIEPVIAEIDGVVVANRNAPDQTVLSGLTPAVEEAVAKLEASGLKASRINVACAFHSPVVGGAMAGFEAALRAGEVRPLRAEVWSNITAAPYPGDAESSIRLLTEQIARPVRFVEQIEAMYAAGARVFVEVGPGRIQAGLVGRILGDRSHLAVPTGVKGEGGIERLLRALARLAVAGVQIDPPALWEGRVEDGADIESLEPLALSPTAWIVDGHWARPASGVVPAGSYRPVTEPPLKTERGNGGRSAAAAPFASAADDREAAMVEYLRGVREAIEAQRDVMLRYLGAEPPPRPNGGREAEAAPVLMPVEPIPTPEAAARPRAAPAMSAPRPGATARPLSEALLAIVSERTGYPTEMLDLDLDLEADLSIDSIKRIEILGALNEEAGLAERLGDRRDELLEELAGIKTLRGIVAWIDERPPAPAAEPVAPATERIASGAPVAAMASVATARSLSEALLAIVSERTGYPPDMLDLDLDLEADLSIDSIKRIEILGALNEETKLAERLGDRRDELLEELAGIKTLRGIVGWIEERSAPPVVDAASRSTNGSAAVKATNGSTPVAVEPGALRRFRFEVRPTGPAERNGARLEGRSFAITDDGRGVATALAELLGALGARTEIVGADASLSRVDGLVDLGMLAPDTGPQDVKTLFRLAKRALEGGACWIVAATGMGGAFGYGRNGSGRPGQGGAAGFLRSLSKERPEVHVRAVDLDPAADARRLAAQLVEEILSTGGPVEVGYAGEERRELAIVPAPLEAAHSASGLDARSVVLVTGGARGITAHLSVGIARRYGCALELVGRSPRPDSEDPPELAEANDERTLKQRLIALSPGARPAEIERRVREVLAPREIRSTLAAIRAAGGRARYHSADVRVPAAFGAVIDEIYGVHGRVDVAIHAAGLIEDKLLVHKTPESFERVFDTKVAGALTLVERLRSDTRLVVFFSSAAGIYGNVGQTDYAAANDVLDRLALHLAETGPMRAISVAWGPWDSAGMVSPELRREYARRGIGLIALDAGVAGLLAEIERPKADAARIVLMGAADPRAAG